MNGWRARLVLAAGFYVVNAIHGMATDTFPNTPEWLLAYHGTACALDFLLLRCAPLLIAGRLCDDIQALCFASMFMNALGWALYLAYIPPDLCNILVLGIIHVQYIRLLFVDRRDADIDGRDLFRCHAGSWREFNFGKALS